MDPNDIPPRQQQQQLGMHMAHFGNNFNATALMGHAGASSAFHQRLPYGVLAPQQHPRPSQTLGPLGFGEGSLLSSQPVRLGIEHSHSYQTGMRKRGRPRKYDPDNTTLGLSSLSPLLSGGGGGDNVDVDEQPTKRKRGRPLGSGKKFDPTLVKAAGKGFTPHVIEVNKGEDIMSRVMNFLEKGQQTICILSGSGVVSNVTLTQVSNPSETFTNEGQFQIVTLAGSLTNYEVDGSIRRNDHMTIALARENGQMLGGAVFGPLIAATHVKVTVVSFVREPTKVKQSSGSGNNALEPTSAPANMSNVGANSQGPISDSSDENESGGNNNNNNNNGNNGNSLCFQQQQQQQLVDMYHRGWGGDGR